MGPLAERLASRSRRAFAYPAIDLLGFSMGGVFGRTWIQRAGGAQAHRRFFLCGQPPARAAPGQICPSGCWWELPNSQLAAAAACTGSCRSPCLRSGRLPQLHTLEQIVVRLAGGAACGARTRLCSPYDPPGHPQRSARPGRLRQACFFRLIHSADWFRPALVARPEWRIGLGAGRAAAKTLEHLLGTAARAKLKLSFA